MVYLDHNKKQRQQIHDEACVVYQFVYEYKKLKKDTNKCYFSCHVTWEAHCEIYSHNQRKQPILISPSLLYDILYWFQLESTIFKWMETTS